MKLTFHLRFYLLVLGFTVNINICSSQEIYLSTTKNIYALDIETCSIQQIININNTLYDISFHPDGSLYGLNGRGELYFINVTTGNTNTIAEFEGDSFNSLTISSDEIAYAAGSNGKFASYDFKTGQVNNLENIGFNATGDLTFYDGELYAACSNDRIIKVNIEDPSMSTVFMQDSLSKAIWGIVSNADECDDIKTYAVTSFESDIYLMDFENKSLDLVCELGIAVTGGASTSEFRESDPLEIDSIYTQNPDCDGHGGTIEIIASGGSTNYRYTLNGQQLSSNNYYENLASGVYIVTVFDEFCEISDTVSIDLLNNIVIEEVEIEHATCGLDNGSIVFNIENLDHGANLLVGRYKLSDRSTI